MSEESKGFSSLTLSSSGEIEIKTAKDLHSMLSLMQKSGMLPKQYSSVEQAVIAYNFAAQVGLSPLMAMRQIAVIHGQPSLFGDLPLALAQHHGCISRMQEIWVDKDQKEICYANKNLNIDVWAAVCIINRDESKYEGFFSLDEAAKANLYPAKYKDGKINDGSPWMKYTKLMLRYKARSIALKAAAPDALNGIAIGEYDHDVTLDTLQYAKIKDVTPQKVSELNEAFV